MNANVSRLLSGGSVYNTVYPADIGQNTYSGTQNVGSDQHRGREEGIGMQWI